jgi:hypothetical protein
MIASWVQQFVWTKPPSEPESTAVQSSLKSPQTASVAQTAPAAHQRNYRLTHKQVACSYRQNAKAAGSGERT